MAIRRAPGPRSLTGSGDVFSERAFEDLYHDAFATVWAIARRVARTDEEAEDVCQKAFMTVFEYWSQGRLREQPTHLLYRVARRGAIDILRARQRRIRLFDALVQARPEEDVVGGPLGRALRSLRPEDAALVLLQAAGLSYEEIARVERTSVAAIRSRLFRARRDLARRYDEEGGAW